MSSLGQKIVRRVQDSAQGVGYVCPACLLINPWMGWLFCNLTDDPLTPCSRSHRPFTPDYVEANTEEFEECDRKEALA